MASKRGSRTLPGGVLVVAGAHVAVLLAVANRYGYHRDELYFLEAGHHLALGYVDNPPLVPFLARVQTEVLGGSVAAIRLLPALATGLAVVLAALLARELGGNGVAQVLAAAAVASAGFVLSVGHLLSTATFDFAFWLALALIGARLLRTGDPRWWLAFGAVAGVGLWNKHLVVILAVAFTGGLLLERRWDLLATPWLLAGGGLALVIAAPTIAWEAANGWPQLELAAALSDRIGQENRILLVPMQVLMLGPLLIPLGIAGARRLWHDAERADSRFRPLLWSYAIALGLTLVAGGRPYYPLPLAAVVVIAGAVALTMRAGDDRRLFALVAVNLAFAIPLSLPVLPVGVLAGTPVAAINDTLAETVGWPELADTVAAVAAGLPDGERQSAVILTGSYGEAGALDRYGPERGLPEVYSGHNSYWHWRRPTDDTATVIGVRMSEEFLDEHFEACELVTRLDNGVGMDNEAQDQPVWVCRGLRGTWQERWADFRRYS